MDDLKITAADGLTELVVRKGEAVPVYPPCKVEMVGTLKAPADYLQHKTANSFPKDAYLKVYNSSGRLELRLDEKNSDGASITGVLKLNPEIELFGINTDVKWSINEFRQFIQRKSYFFDGREEYTKMLSAMQKFKSEVVKVYQNENANDGNAKLMLEAKVQNVNMVSSFKIKMPIYLGYQDRSFNVEIGLDVTSSETRLFLYSEELYNLQEDLKKSYIAEQINRFEKSIDFWPFSVITID